jgi:hypothetical protein
VAAAFDFWPALKIRDTSPILSKPVGKAAFYGAEKYGKCGAVEELLTTSGMLVQSK